MTQPEDPILGTVPPPVPPPPTLPTPPLPGLVPPVLSRMVTEDLSGENNYALFEVRPDGLDGYTLEDYYNLTRNNGWVEEDDGDWEREDLTDGSDDDEEEDDDEDWEPAIVFNNQA